MRRTLRELIPEIEIDWLLPAWLLIAILAAFVAETVTIGLSVWRLYGLWSGWAIGGVVASVQAIGSMMWARAAQHNAQRDVKFKWLGSTKKGDRRRVENKGKSEPAMNVQGPASVSVIAGIISAWLAGALYAVDGLTALDVALAVAAPAGSVSAALLNGVFAYGETAVANWKAESGRTQKGTGPSVQKSVQPQDRPQASDRTHDRSQVSAQTGGRTRKRTVESVQESDRTVSTRHSDTSPAVASHLAELREKLLTQRQAGARRNGTFRRAEVETLLDVSSTHAKTIIRYGLDHGVLEETKRYQYQFR